MEDSRQYDTVAFDVKDNATMLFFAKTTDEGDISDYLLLMRTVDEDFNESIYVEINEQQFGGHTAGGNPQRAIESGRFSPHRLPRFVDQIENSPGILVQVPTFCRQHDNAAVTLKKGDIQTCFQSRDLLTDSRLRQRHRFSSPGEVLRLGSRNECPQLTQFHGRIIASTTVRGSRLSRGFLTMENSTVA